MPFGILECNRMEIVPGTVSRTHRSDDPPTDLLRPSSEIKMTFQMSLQLFPRMPSSMAPVASHMLSSSPNHPIRRMTP